MKKKLLLSIIFLPLIISFSMAQIKSDFTYEVPSFLTSDFQHVKSTKFKSGFELQTLTTHSKISNLIMQSQFGPAKDVWIGETQTSVINFKKLMISTNYDFDVHGTLKRTTTNIRLNKLISYRIF